MTFDELLPLMDSPQTLSDLQKASDQETYGPIKASIQILTIFADSYDENQPQADLLTFKKASNLLIEAFILPLIIECSCLKNKNQIDLTAQETIKQETNNRLLCKWWMVYLTILSDTHTAKKNQPKWNLGSEVWFNIEENKMLMESFNLIDIYT